MKKDRTKIGPTPKQNKWSDPPFLERIKCQAHKHVDETLKDYCLRAGITLPKHVEAKKR